MVLKENLNDEQYLYDYVRQALCGNSTSNCSELSQLMSYHDYETEPPPMPYERLIVPVIFGMTFVVGLVGNLLVIFVVLRNRTMKTVTNVFLVNLAVSDVLFLTFCAPFTATIYIIPAWPFGEHMCKFVNYMMMATMGSCVMTLTAVSVDRYQAVVHPVSSKIYRTLKNARVVVGVIWVIALLAMTPITAISKILSYWDNGGIRAFCNEYLPDRRSRQAYNLITFGLLYLLPLSIISGCYMRMSRHLCSTVTPLGPGINLTESTAKAFKSRRKVARMVAVVVLVFALCWLPIHIVHLRNEFGNGQFSPTFYVLKIVAHAVSYLNSAANPIVYSFMSETFRRCFKAAFRCRRRVSSKMFVVARAANRQRPLGRQGPPAEGDPTPPPPPIAPPPPLVKANTPSAGEQPLVVSRLSKGWTGENLIISANHKDNGNHTQTVVSANQNGSGGAIIMASDELETHML